MFLAMCGYCDEECILANMLLLHVTGSHDSLCRSFGVVLWEVRAPHNPNFALV